MSTPPPTPKELRINPPSDFDGSSSKATQWLLSVRLYLHLNQQLYDTDEKKIIFSLSYMTKDSAKVWSTTFTHTALGHNPINFGTFTDFQDDFKKSFIHEDTKSNAIIWLTATKVSEKLPLGSYIQEFKNKVSISEITDNNVLINYFAVGIPRSLMRRIMSMDTSPGTIEGWYEKALHFKTQWERADVLDPQKKSYNSPAPKPYVPRQNTTPRDPNAMDVDAVRLEKLTDQERQRCMREGLCFRCRLPGHSANKCRVNNRPNAAPQVARIVELPQESQEEATIAALDF